MLLLNHFLFKLELFLLCFTYLVSSSQNFVTFSSKTDKLTKKSYFFARIKIFTIVFNIFKHALNQFSKHMETAIVA